MSEMMQCDGGGWGWGNENYGEKTRKGFCSPCEHTLQSAAFSLSERLQTLNIPHLVLGGKKR